MENYGEMTRIKVAVECSKWYSHSQNKKPLKCGRKAGDCCLFYCCLCFSCLIPPFPHKFIPKEALVMVGKIFLIKNQPFVCTPPKKRNHFSPPKQHFLQEFPSVKLISLFFFPFRAVENGRLYEAKMVRMSCCVQNRFDRTKNSTCFGIPDVWTWKM